MPMQTIIWDVILISISNSNNSLIKNPPYADLLPSCLLMIHDRWTKDMIYIMTVFNINCA